MEKEIELADWFVLEGIGHICITFYIISMPLCVSIGCSLSDVGQSCFTLYIYVVLPFSVVCACLHCAQQTHTYTHTSV